MCNPLPGSRCANNGMKGLTSAITKAEGIVNHAEKLTESIRVSRRNEDIEFNAERYDNVAKSIETAMTNINERKVYFYASTTPTPQKMKEISETTQGFDTYERGFLKSESDLVTTSKYLKKYQEAADETHKKNKKSDTPVSQQDVAKALHTKTFAKLDKDLKAKVDASFKVKLQNASTPEEKAAVKENHAKHLESLKWASKMASNDALKIYAPKSKDDE